MNMLDIIRLVGDPARNPEYAGKHMPGRDYCRDFVVNQMEVLAICNADHTVLGTNMPNFADVPGRWTVISTEFEPIHMMELLKVVKNTKVKTLRMARRAGFRVSTKHPNIVLRGNENHPESKQSFCNDCQRMWPEPYMLADMVWRAVVKEPQCFLCFDCLERRLGRFLVEEDFTSSSINKPIRLGIKIAKAQS